MNRFRRFLIWFLWIAGAGLAMLAAAAILLSGMIDPESLKETILKDINGREGYHADLKKIDMLFWPWPRIVVHEPQLTLPGDIAASSKTLTLVPRILPLFLAKLQLGLVRVDTPQFTVKLPDTSTRQTEQEEGWAESIIEEKASALLGLVGAVSPGLIVFLDQGRLQLTQKGETIFWFRNLSGRIISRTERLNVKLSCESNLCERVFIKGWLEPKDLKTKGRILLTRLRPQLLIDYFRKIPFQPPGDGEADLEISFAGTGKKVFQSRFKGSVKKLLVQQGDETLDLRCEVFDGRFNVNADSLDITLSKLDLTYPKISLTGHFYRDSRIPLVLLALEGREADAASVRKVVLALAGNNRDVQKTFDVIRAGRVPFIRYNGVGKSLDQLHKSQHFVISGSMEQGRIFIPKARIDVEDASGQVVISRGILDGWNLKGRTGDSHGHLGVLRVGLKKWPNRDAPFYFNIKLDANLVDLVPVLKRTVKSDPFVRELNLIKDVEGRAKGRMVLGETLKTVQAKVYVTEFALNSHYQRIPYPVTLRGGLFSYEGTQILVESLNGNIGKSFFSGVAADLNWAKESQLRLSTSSQARIALEEVHSWLLSYEKWKKDLKGLESVRGNLHLKSLELSGPTRRFKDWQFQLKGEFENLAIRSSFAPETVTVKTGKVEANQESLSFNECETSLWDAALNITGSIGNYSQGPLSGDLALHGNIGTQAMPWISGLVGLPSWVRPRSTVSISQGRVSWAKGGRMAFSGNFQIKGGPKIALDAVQTPEEAIIRKLLINDDNSDASLSLNLKNGELDLTFAGTLANASLENVLAKKEVLPKWINGEFRLHVPLAAPFYSLAFGEVRFKGFGYSRKANAPVTIEEAHIRPHGNRFDVESAVIGWKGTRGALKGSVDCADSAFQLNMEIAADAISWDELTEESQGGNEDKVPTQQVSLLDIPLRGSLKVKADSFTLGKLTWQSLQANIAFKPETVDVEVAEASLCGIPTPGVVKVSNGEVHLRLKPAAKNQEFDPTLTCLWEKKGLLNGAFELKGELEARVPREQWSREGVLKSLTGKLELHAKEGRVYRLGFLTKIFSLLNITEIYKGQVPDLSTEGFAYDSIAAAGKVQDGKVLFEEATIEAPTIKMVWEGEVNLTDNKMRCTVLVAPLRTVDKVVNNVPIIGSILGGTLISIPVQVSGNIADPDVFPMSPAAVGSKLIGYMKRTLQLPFKIIQPAK